MIRRPSKVADSSCASSPHVRESLRRRRRRTPQGHVPVRVGEEMERFEVRADLLSRQPFLDLLHLSATEFGYEQRGVLRIPCPVPIFRRLLAAAPASLTDVAAARRFTFSAPSPISSSSSIPPPPRLPINNKTKNQ